MNIKGEEDIDEYTFNMWKSELQRGLPSFWDSISRRQQKQKIPSEFSLKYSKLVARYFLSNVKYKGFYSSWLMNYKSPKLTVDGIVLKDGKILLIKRKNQPFEGKWALPGGFVEYGEKTENATVREVFEETGLKTKINHLVGVYSDPNRDPRGHTVSIVYVLDICNGELKSGDDTCDAKFFDLKNLPDLSFDHEGIIKDVLGGI